MAQAGVVALFVAAALLGTLSGVLFAFADDLPEISALDDYKPNTITRLLARDGQVIGEFATERRVVIGYDDMSPFLRNAIIATEDADFEQHFGLSATRILVTLVNDVLKGEMAGASTITQQLARNLFPIGFEKTVERKVKEAIIAIQLERRYTKREIFAFYANQIYFGHGAYGVEAASRMYFNKPAKDLTLEEAAMIAAIIQAPERLSPFVDPRRTTNRRNYVLQRMADEGFVGGEGCARGDRAAARAPRPADRPSARSRPTSSKTSASRSNRNTAPRRCTKRGFACRRRSIAELQQAANVAMDRGLRRIDKRRSGYRRPARNVLAEGHALQRFTTDRWNRPIAPGDIVPAVVVDVPERGTTANAHIRIGAHQVDLPRTGFAWTRRTSADRAVQGRRPHRGGSAHAQGRRAGDRVPRAASLGGRCAARDRQPHRAGARDGRRLQLRAQQVQSRDAGAPADGLGLQADRLHGGHRPRLHAGVRLHRRTGGVRRRAKVSLRIHRSITTASSRGR